MRGTFARLQSCRKPIADAVKEDPMRTSQPGASLFLSAVLAFTLTACGDGGLIAHHGDATAAGNDLFVPKTDVLLGDGQSADTTADDTVTPPDGDQPDAPPPTDAHDQDATDQDTPQPIDVPEFDVPLDQFALVSHTPGDGETGVASPITVTMTFSATVKPESISANTIFVTTHGDKPVLGKFATNDKVVTFTSAGPVQAASRVQVRVTSVVQAKKGNSLPQEALFHFYTQPMPGLAPYEKLAARYAPTVRQGVNVDSPSADLLRSIDFDGDWNLSNNAKNTKPAPTAKVAWSVIETQSHFFITYVFYWAHRSALDSKLVFDNDTAGSIVAVAKYPTEHPVALTTYFKQKADEQMWGWVTAESGLVAPGAKTPSFLRAVLPQDQLFPKAAAADTYGCEGIAGCTPRRYPAYLTASTHQSCLWADAGDKSLYECDLSPAIQVDLKWIDYVPATTGQPASGNAGAPGPVYGYELQSLHEFWWPHRDEAGANAVFVDTTFTYAPPVDRPFGGGLPVGSKFLTSGSNDNGRPPWAWMWKPGTNVSYYDMPRGTPFYDPSWALYMRLGGIDAKLPPFDATTKTGYSMDHCLHPFFFVDLRDSAPCKGSLP